MRNIQNQLIEQAVSLRHVIYFQTANHYGQKLLEVKILGKNGAKNIVSNIYKNQTTSSQFTISYKQFTRRRRHSLSFHTKSLQDDVVTVYHFI